MEAVNRDILSDNFRLEGMKLPDLKKDLQMMNETTKIVEVTPSDLTLYSIVGMKKTNFMQQDSYQMRSVTKCFFQHLKGRNI